MTAFPRRWTLSVLAVLLFSSVWTVFGRQAPPPAFGPVDLVRGSGAPQKFRWTFTAVPGPHRVCLFNGGSSGQFARVSSANVRLNGAPVFLQSNFNQNVPTLSQSLTLLSRNELTVELASKPGSGFTLWVQAGESCAGSTTNSDPIITTTPATTGQWLEPYTYGVGAMDADHDPLQFSLPAGPPDMTIDPETGVVTWVASGFGTFDVTVRVTDGKGGEATQSFQLNVPVPPNRPPDLMPLPNRQVPLGATFKLGLAADDPDYGDSLTFDLLGGPAGASVSPTPMLVWTPQANQLGQHVLNVRVRDLAGESDTGSFIIDVINTNGAPVLDPQADETTTAGASVVRSLTAIDPNPGDTLTFALVSGPAGMTVSPAGALVWTPAAADLGPHQVKVSVTDNAGLSDAGLFTIDVAVPPVAQPITAVDDLYAARRSTTLNVAAPGVLANDINPGGVGLTAQLVTPPTKGTLSLNPDGGFSYAQTPPAPGSTEPALKYAFMSSVINEGNLTQASNRSHGAVADLNRDGIPEIVLMSMAQFGVRRLAAVRGDTGALAWMVDAYQPNGSPQIVLAEGGAGNDGSLSIGDLDGDGYLEILAVHSDHETSNLRRKLIAFNHDGTYRWTSDDILDGVNVIQTTGMFQIDQADLDGDGLPEILVHHTGRSPLTPAGISSEDLVTVFNNDGHIRWTQRVPGLPSQDTLTVADIDLDGRPDIVIGTAVLNWQGNITWNFKSTNPGVVDLAVANLDDDPFAEIVYLDRFGGIHLYEHTGAKKWGPVTRPGGFSVGRLAIGDTDGDGLPEIVLPRAVSTGAIEVRDSHGNLLRVMNLPGALNTLGHGGSITIFDLNGDGRPEVIYQAIQGSFDTQFSHGSLFIFDGPTGDMLHEVHASRSSATESGPIVVDVDGDGSAEIVTGGWNDGVLLNVFEAASGTWAQTRPIWNQDSYHVTNVESNGRIPAHETVNWLTPGLNNYRVNVPLPAERTEDTDQFTYVASNGELTSNVATVRLDLLPPNTAPRILSLAPTAASPDIEYLYAVRAVDPDLGETLGYSLPMGPAGMVIGSSTGLIRWTPTSGASGSVMVVVQVTDSQGQTDSQQFVIQLGPPVSVPNVVGQAIADAQSALTAASLVTGQMSTSPSPTVAAGLVMSQDPAAGSLVATSSAINLIVSSGPAPVAVPNLVGKTERAAEVLLTASGLGSVVTREFSNTVQDGLVITQSPAAGMSIVPGAVTMAVSVGSGLALRLSRDVTTADAPLPFTVVEYDLTYAESPAPPLTYVVSSLATSLGGLPTVAGGVIVPAADSRGAFRVTATDASGRSVSAQFVVTFPRAAGTRVMSDVYADFSSALADIDGLARQARQALAAQDVGAMRSLLDQMVQRWRLVDVRELRLTTPFGLPQGFFPTSADLASLGLTPTPDDLIAQEVLKDAVDDLKAWIDGLRAPDTSMAELRTLANQFNKRAARLTPLTLSEWGAIKGHGAMTVILSERLPALYDALMDELAQVVANGEPEPFDITSGPFVADSTLAEQLTTMAVSYVVDTITEWAVEPYKNAKQFAKDTLGHAAWSAAIVAAAQHFKTLVNGQSLTAVVAGASMSFHVFESGFSFLEGELDTETPAANVVLTIGPNLVSAIAGANNIRTAAKNAMNAESLFDAIWNFYETFVKPANTALEDIKTAVENAVQPEAEGLNGCIFSSAPTCGQLFFKDGIRSVYDYKAPVPDMSGLPVPILFIVYNTTSGVTFVDTPVFLPKVK